MAARKTPSGGPKTDKPWRDMLMIAVKERDGDQRKLRRIADAVVKAAMSGDMTAAKEIGDRLDGKATQPISGDADNPLKIEIIERVIIDKAEDRDR